MNLPWFRLYTEFLTDPKIQILSFEDQRHYVMLLCMKSNGVLDTRASLEYRDKLICKALCLDSVGGMAAKQRLIEGFLIDDHWQPLAWERRQFDSDSSTLRVRKHRLLEAERKQRNSCETLQKRSGNGVDTDTDRYRYRYR